MLPVYCYCSGVFSPQCVREILYGIVQREGKGREKFAQVTCKTIIYDLCYLCSGVILVVFSPWYLSDVRETLYGLV